MIHEALSAPGWFISPTTTMKQMNDPLILWEKFALSIDLDPAMRSDISDELASSIRWQAYSYDHPPNAPSLLSPSIDWEQSILEGHPTHPVSMSLVCGRKPLTYKNRCTRHGTSYPLCHHRLQGATICIPLVCVLLSSLERVCMSQEILRGSFSRFSKEQ